ncbi:MAG: type I pullulanase [Clostridia bacterium]|nr:type I pullulanase [Clostridia bacterium]
MGLGASPAVAVGGQELFELYYPGDDLGAVYSSASTQFRVFAPTALAAWVALYATPDSLACEVVEMHPDCDGTWVASVAGDLAGICYTYRVRHGGGVNEAVDPYARALTLNGVRGIVVDLAATNPQGWAGDERPPFCRPTDAVVYETHVRDYTVSRTSGAAHRGKYLGLSERGTRGPGMVRTGIDHLVELGVTHVHLMPIMDYASVDESDSQAYNWGYDPYHFFVPEGSYSIAPECGTARITEVKRLVQAMHQAGIRVILDVVFNHTYTVEDSPYHLIVPDYYHRTGGACRFTNGSGCGNELATERPMVRKLVLDSLKYWVREYRVDGFRFDLMALIDYETVKEIASSMRTIDPTLLIYGEPWSGGPSGLPTSRMFTKGRQRSLGVALFNDGFRNAIKGDNDGAGQGYATGAPGRELAVMSGVVGAIRYSQEIHDFAQAPGESVNYVSCHDNLTLWDKIVRSSPFDSKSDQIRLDLLAQAIILTSQGIPFIEGGAEILRTKGGNRNSYCAGDSVNGFDWGRKGEYRAVFDYYRGLIQMRRSHPAFRMASTADIARNLRFLRVPAGVIAFSIDGKAAGDDWETIVVIYNANRNPVELALPSGGPWKAAVAGMRAGVQSLRRGAFRFLPVGACDDQHTSVVVAPISAAVLFK